MEIKIKKGKTLSQISLNGNFMENLKALSNGKVEEVQWKWQNLLFQMN